MIEWSETPDSFTVRYHRRVDELVTPCGVSRVLDVEDLDEPRSRLQSFTAVWDTGATHSVISLSVVDACGLELSGFTRVYQVQDSYRAATYIVNIELPNGLVVPDIRVAASSMLGAEDVLIGMDIIGYGDFAISHTNGNTKFTFRYPSTADIDFTANSDT